MNAAWKWVVVAMVSGAVTIGAGGKLPPDRVAANNSAPPAKEPPKPEWIPKLEVLDGVLPDMSKSIAWVESPPSAFPDLKLPEQPADDPFGKKYEAAFAKLCPRMMGKTALVIEPADGTLEKLLKARLHRGVMQWIRHREVLRCELWNQGYAPEIVEGLTDMEAVCLELWSAHPKELLPWLEELVIVAKEFEQFQTTRALRENRPPHRVDLAVRHRLRAEATLWKVKNRK
jgi:hypothetical protein